MNCDLLHSNRIEDWLISPTGDQRFIQNKVIYFVASRIYRVNHWHTSCVSTYDMTYVCVFVPLMNNKQPLQLLQAMQTDTQANRQPHTDICHIANSTSAGNGNYYKQIMQSVSPYNLTYTLLCFIYRNITTVDAWSGWCTWVHTLELEKCSKLQLQVRYKSDQVTSSIHSQVSPWSLVQTIKQRRIDHNYYYSRTHSFLSSPESTLMKHVFAKVWAVKIRATKLDPFLLSW